MQTFCQFFLLGYLFLGFMASAHADFTGRPAKPPAQYSEFVGSCFAFGLLALLMLGAGTFDGMLGN